MRRDEVDLVRRVQRLHCRARGPVDQLLRSIRIFCAFDHRDAFSRGANALFRKTDFYVVTFGLGVQCVNDKEDAPRRLPEAHRQRATATAFRVRLNALAHPLHEVERLGLIATIDLKHGEDTCDRCTGGAGIGHLQHVGVGRIEQIIPRGGCCELVISEKFLVGHEHQRIVGNRRPHATNMLESRWQRGSRRRRVRLENAFFHARAVGFDRAAEQHVHFWIALLGNQARQCFA